MDLKTKITYHFHFNESKCGMELIRLPRSIQLAFWGYTPISFQPRLVNDMQTLLQASGPQPELCTEAGGNPTRISLPSGVHVGRKLLLLQREKKS